jgi:bacterial leucyl aminopeptidase
MKIKMLFPITLISSALIFFSFNATAAENPLSDNVWITIGSDAATLINSSSSKTLTLNSTTLKRLDNKSIAIVNIPKSQIDSLNHFMHDNFYRCAGFIYHESFEQAQEYLNAANQRAPSVAIDYTIDNPTGVNALLGEFNAANLSSTVASLSAFNNRYFASQTGVQAANWIRDHWASISSSRSDISVQLYTHSWNQPSVIATVTGTTYPDEVVIVGGHLDSINSFSPSSGRAPGADDNASGIAIATEALRSIVASGFKPQRTLKFMGYAAEEDGLRGSKAIAQDFKSSGVNVVGVVQFDMSGYQGSNVDIVFITDYTNSAQTAFMTQLLDTYLPSVNYGFDECGYACSDHASWHLQGFPASMPFEAYLGQYNPTIHTSRDTSYNQNHATNFAKLTAVYIAELAKGGTFEFE